MRSSLVQIAVSARRVLPVDRMGPRAIKVGTRGSALALTQTGSVVAALRARHPELDITVHRITTKGDVMRDVPLTTLGGRGVFVDAIEEELRQGSIDLAVHSAKDLPSRVPADLAIAAFLERADARDVLVSRAGLLASLPAGARVGTSSLRRVCLLHSVRPDIQTVDLRGNVDTRLRKLDAGDYDAIMLAAAGLVRLGLQDRISEWLPAETMLPSPGQGALAIEIRADDNDLRELVRPLSHAPTESALAAERAFLARLGVGCAAAVGAHATLDHAGTLMLRAMIGAADGRSVRGVRTGPAADATGIGESLAGQLLGAGGDELVAASERITVS
jgi:hydroxymethylbilane synthase